MCDDALRKDLFFLQYVLDLFVMQEKTKTCDEEFDSVKEDDIVTLLNGYENLKNQK